VPLAVSLPLDTGQAERTIPGNLRRAVLTRHRRCCFPGCEVPATACQIHHFIVIHAWGWTLRLNPDGTTTATGPDGRILRDHDPPRRAA
jgi:hypothetical protein